MSHVSKIQSVKVSLKVIIGVVTCKFIYYRFKFSSL